MASKGIEVISLVLVLVVILCGGAMAQSSCTSALVGLSPCLNYITGNSSTPSSSCCLQLGNVVQAQPQCLCPVLSSGGAAALGLNINQTQALTLPGACNAQTPPLSQCNTANGPTSSAATPAASSAAGSPSDPSDETPDSPSTPSDSNNPSGGSKQVPSTDGTTSNGRNVKVPLHIVLTALFIVTVTSAATRV